MSVRIKHPDLDKAALDQAAAAKIKGQRSRVTDLLSSHQELPREVPRGFSRVSELNRDRETNHPTMASDYEALGLSTPKPGQYALNNNTIVLADHDGNMHVMLKISDPKRREENLVRLKKAIADLESLGYKKSSFMVPFSNEA